MILLLTLEGTSRRKKVSLKDDTATLLDLTTLACQEFGITSCSFRHGYPPVELPLGTDDNNNNNNKTLALSETNIQNYDRIIVVATSETPSSTNCSTMGAASASATITSTDSVAKKNKKRIIALPPPLQTSSYEDLTTGTTTTNHVNNINHKSHATKDHSSSNSFKGNKNSTKMQPQRMKMIIPGLTRDHYFKDSKQSVSKPPTCISFSSSKIAWEAFGSKGEIYKISVSGNISNVNRLKLHCTCQAYRKLGRATKTRDGKYRVCKHLAAALESVMDTNNNGNNATTKASSGSRKKENHQQAVVNLLDSDYEEQLPKEEAVRGSHQQTITTTSSKKRPMENPYAATNKKLAAAASAQPSSSNQKKKATTKKKMKPTTPQSNRETPFKLYATPQDLQVRNQISDKSHWCWSQCKTLQELVFGYNDNGSDSSIINIDSEIQWIVISNYLVDFETLARQLKPIQTIPRVTIFYGSSSSPNPPASYFQNVSSSSTSAVVDIVQLDPKQPAHSPSNPLPQSHQFGTHHTKLFLVGSENKIRVVVSTANLVDVDNVKAQAAYVEEFDIKNANDVDTTSEFEETLVKYIESYGYNKKRNWIGSGSAGGGRQRELLSDVLARYDYSTARGVLIPSIPGYHNIVDDDASCGEQQQIGQMKLRQTIQKYARQTTTPRPVICQFSSMSSLSEKYLHTLQSSMDTYLARQPLTAKSSNKIGLQLKLVYPCVQEIRDSVEGYRGGGTVPGNHKAVIKPFLRPLWHKWSGSSSRNGGNSQSSSSSGVGKPNNVPHMKSFYQISGVGKPNNVPHMKSFYQINNGQDGFDWLCITSHNISQAAWGNIGNNSWGGQRLYVRSWELGVFISPQTLGVDKLICYNGPGGNGSVLGRNNGDEITTTTSTVPMPYHTHSLQRYARADEPWAWDIEYPIADRFGFHSMHG